MNLLELAGFEQVDSLVESSLEIRFQKHAVNLQRLSDICSSIKEVLDADSVGPVTKYLDLTREKYEKEESKSQVDLQDSEI